MWTSKFEKILISGLPDIYFIIFNICIKLRKIEMG